MLSECQRLLGVRHLRAPNVHTYTTITSTCDELKTRQVRYAAPLWIWPLRRFVLFEWVLVTVLFAIFQYSILMQLKCVTEWMNPLHTIFNYYERFFLYLWFFFTNILQVDYTRLNNAHTHYVDEYFKRVQKNKNNMSFWIRFKIDYSNSIFLFTVTNNNWNILSPIPRWRGPWIAASASDYRASSTRDRRSERHYRQLASATPSMLLQANDTCTPSKGTMHIIFLLPWLLKPLYILSL